MAKPEGLVDALPWIFVGAWMLYLAFGTRGFYHRLMMIWGGISIPALALPDVAGMHIPWMKWIMIGVGVALVTAARLRREAPAIAPNYPQVSLRNGLSFLNPFK